MTDRTSTAAPGRRRLVFALVAVALLAVAAEFAIEGPPWAGSQRVLWRGSSVPGHIGAHFRYFDGNDARPFSGNAGASVTIGYDLEPNQGILTLHLLSPEGDAIWTRSATETAKGSATIPLPESGRYRVEISGEKTRGSFDVNYHVARPAAP